MFPVNVVEVTIANGESLSTKGFIGHGKLVAIVMPAEWDTANITFQGSYDGITFADIYDDTGDETEVVAVQGHYVSIDRYEGAPWMKLRSGTGSSVVAQTPGRTLLLVVQKFSDGG